MENPEAVIPHGIYCYEHLFPTGNGRFRVVGSCKYLKHKIKFGIHVSYCSYLKRAATDADFSWLFWDSIKECGVNDPDAIDN